MCRGSIPQVMIWLTFVLLFGLSWGQSKPYETFDWRPISRPRQTSLRPYSDDTPTTSSYHSRYYDSSPYPGNTGYYLQESKPYSDYPVEDHTSSHYPKSQPYKYAEDSGSYENYGYGNGDHFDMDAERYGGFGGTGDTRGYGAYDYPKKVQEVPQDLQYHAPVETDFPDLMRIGGTRSTFYKRSPVHPLPPPL